MTSLLERLESLPLSTPNELSEEDIVKCKELEEEFRLFERKTKEYIIFLKTCDRGTGFRNSSTIIKELQTAIQVEFTQTTHIMERHFRFKYNIDISNFHRYQLETFTYHDVLNNVVNELTLTEENRWLRTIKKEAYGQFDTKGKLLVLPNYCWITDPNYGVSGRTLYQSSLEKLFSLTTLLSYFENGCNEPLQAFIDFIKELSYKNLKSEDFKTVRFDDLDNVKSFRLFKSGRLDIGFKDNDTLKQFTSIFRKDVEL